MKAGPPLARYRQTAFLKKHFFENYFLYHQENLHLSKLSGWEEDFDKFLNITIGENDEVSGLHTVEK